MLNTAFRNEDTWTGKRTDKKTEEDLEGSSLYVLYVMMSKIKDIERRGNRVRPVLMAG